METMYINLDARRITVWGGEKEQRACVGQQAVCYTVLPRRKAPARPGKVLDFEACRRAMEGACPAPAEEVPPAMPPAPERRRGRRWDLALAVDVGVSLGVLALVAAVAVRFFLG